MAFDGYNRAPTSALTRARTVYVDSVNGNDYTGDGSQSRPWATLERAWVERCQYLELRAPFVVQLIGVGPYQLDFPIGSSDCSPDGRFIVLGDPLAGVQVVASGTATGDMSSFVIPTSAIVGSHLFSWVRITSGNCAGCLFQIVDNAANSITVANQVPRTTNGAIANGDTWEIVQPITEVSIANAPASGLVPNPGSLNNWQGTFAGQSTILQPTHILYGLRITGPGTLRFASGSYAIGFCRVAATFVTSQAQIQYGMFNEQSRVPGAASSRLFAAGAIFEGLSCNHLNSSEALGIISIGTSTSSSNGSGSRLTWNGGRLAGSNVFFSAGASLESFTASNARYILGRTVTLQGGTLNQAGSWFSAVTSGSCLRVSRGSQAVITGAWTGGTTDAAGYGVDVRGGGRCLFINQTPQLTGGTAGSDLRTTNVAVAANAALNANGNAVGNATDALLGEVLARVAA